MAGMMTQPVQDPFKQGPVLCMDIDGAAAPTGSNPRFDVDNPHKGFVTFDVGDFPLAVHPALPDWFAELEQAFAHCAWVSDWGPECILFAQGAGLDRAAHWRHLESPMDLPPDAPLTWHKLDGVRFCVDPQVPVAIVDDSMAPQTGHDPVDDYILQDIIRFAQRPGPTLLVAPAQEIGLTRPIVDLLCRFADNPRDPVFATRDVRRYHPDHRMRWPDPLPGGQEEPVFVTLNEDMT